MAKAKFPTEPLFVQTVRDWRADTPEGEKTRLHPMAALKRLRTRTRKVGDSLEKLAHEHRVAALAVGGLEPLPFHARSIDHTRKEETLETTGFELRNLAGEVVFAEVSDS